MLPNPDPGTPPEKAFPLTPNTPREQRLVRKFKELIALRVEDLGSVTTQQFVDSLALDLWKLTRTHQ